ncbi:EpsG family protein [Chryseobacterium sp. RLHN22]|uniref:EpsG family protein n=1 Tax=Chryseobacterium sp. RLHN22 TaxID=3437885 RepID=UPI003D9BCC62
MEPTFSFTYSIPYLILFIIFFLLFLWENRLRSKGDDIKIVRYAAMFVFFIFFGFRGYIDTDFALYYSLYENTPSLDNVRGVTDYFWKLDEDYLLKIEPGFKVFLVILKTISKDYFFLQIVSSLIDILFLNYFFNKYSPHYILAFIMFLIFGGILLEVNLLRNSKAIFLFIYSLQFIHNRDPLKFYICNLIGLFFHTSAIFFFPLYFFLHKKIPSFVVWGMFVIGCVLYLGQVKFITPIVLFLGNIMGGVYSIMAEGYSGDSMYSTGYGITLGFVEKILSFILIYAFYNKIGEKIKNEKQQNILFNLFFIYNIVYLYLSEYSVLIDRFATLFVLSYWILYPLLYIVLKRVFKLIFTIILFSFGIYKMYFSNCFITRKYENILWDNPSISRAYYILGKHLDKVIGTK